MTSYVMSGLKMTMMPTPGSEHILEHEIAETDGRPTRCFLTWDIEVVIEGTWEKESGVRDVSKVKRIIMTEPLTGHEAIAWRRAQRVPA